MTRAFALVLVLGVTTLVLGPGLWARFVWDDHLLIVNNAYLREPGQLGTALTAPFWEVSEGDVDPSSGYYRPWVTLTFFAQYALFGVQPFGYHLVNLLVHLGCVALVFGWLRQRVRGPPDARLVGATIGAAVFALHPTRPESVTWVSGSTDLWMTLFAMGALWASARGRTRLAVGLAALAVFAKEAAVMLPLVLVADACLLSEARAERTARLRAAAWVAGAVGLALAVRFAIVPLPPSQLRPSSLVGRTVASLGHYIEASLWPWHPTLLRGSVMRDASGNLLPETHALIAGGLLIALVLALMLLARKRVALRGPLADLCVFGLMLAPVVNVLPLDLEYGLVAERYLYMPLVGLCALAARGAATWLATERPRQRLVVLALGSTLVLALGAATTQRLPAFFNDDDLWASEHQQQPEHTYPLERLAASASNKGLHELALALAQRGHASAVRAHSLREQVRFLLLTAHTLNEMTPDLDRDTLQMLLRFYEDLGAARKATIDTANIHAAIQLPASVVGAVTSNQRLYQGPRAVLCARLGQLQRARDLLTAALERDPRHADGWMQLALVQARMGDFAAASRTIAQARERAPEHEGSRMVSMTIPRAATIAQQQPPDPLSKALQRAHVMLVLGAPGLAREALDPALAEAPDNPDLIQMRARIDAADRRVDLARARIMAARDMWPEHEDRWQQALDELQMLETQRAQQRAAALQ